MFFKDVSRDKHFTKKCSTFKHKSWSNSFIKKSFKYFLQCSSLATRNADAFVEILLVPEKLELLKCIRVNTEHIGLIKKLPSQPSLTVIDFMSYARRYPVEKMK